MSVYNISNALTNERIDCSPRDAMLFARNQAKLDKLDTVIRTDTKLIGSYTVKGDFIRT